MPENRSNQPGESDLPAGLASPARRALAAAGISRLEHFTRISAEELAKLHGMGPKAIRIIAEALAGRGLAFADPAGSEPISEQANRHIPRRPT